MRKLSNISRLIRTEILLTAFAMLALASPLKADQAAAAAISSAVKQFLVEFHEGRLQPDHRIEVSVGYIDPRLNLPDCGTDLSISLNGNQQGLGKLQAKVSCQGSQPWTKFVAAEVSLFAEVLVASENIRRGTLIEDRHIRVMETNLAMLRRTPVSDRDLVIGMELKYPLTSGGAFSLEGLSRPVLVERGDLVQLVAESKNLKIRQQGEALQDGALGKVINVRNNGSEMVVQAEVVGFGRVKVQL